MIRSATRAPALVPSIIASRCAAVPLARSAGPGPA